jgi:hypothetical protein
MRTRFPLFILLLITAIWTGCGSSSNPLTPADNPPDYISQPDLVSSALPDGSRSGMLGLFMGHLDRNSLTGELVPIRESMSKDVFEIIDITNFLTLEPCLDCARIKSVYLTDDNKLAVDIGIRHPFRAGDQSLPPSGKNRLDLHLFNVEGIFITESGENISFPAFSTKLDKKHLLNPDGFTGYLDSALDSIYPTQASAHPYIQFFVDYSEGNYDPAVSPNGFTDVVNPSGYHVMPMGSAEDVRTYILNLKEDESLEFMFAIEATYGVSADNHIQRLNPTYRLPQFNKKAASRISVDIIENNLIPQRPLSTALLGIDVLDINYGVEVGEEIGQMREESNIAYIGIQIPGVTQVVKWSPVPVGGDPRNPDDPLRFEIEILNNLSGLAGKYSGIVKVADTCSSGLNELGEGKDGIGRVKPRENPLSGLFTISEFYTLQYFEIDILANEPPVAVLEASSVEIPSGSSVDLFPGAGTYDPDGSIILYEYDFNYDGITFDINASNTTGNPVTTPVFMNYTSDPITKTFAMRVTDDGDPAQRTIAQLSIIVDPFEASGWAYTWGGSWADSASCVGVGDDGSVYIGGSFRDTVNFDVGGDQGLRTAIGEADAFLLKLNANGEFQWVNTWGGDSDSPDGDTAYGVAIDGDFIYVTGRFFGTCDFNPGDLTEERTADAYGDIYLSKFHNDGTFLWVNNWVDDGIAIANAVETDYFGNVFVAGCFAGDVDFNPGVGSDWHYATGMYNAFVVKLSSSGGFTWAQTWGTLMDRAFDVAIDSSNDVYVTGYFMETVDFNPSSTETDEHTSNGGGDVFLTKYDANGIYQWTETWGGTGTEYWQRDTGYGVAVDDSGQIHVVGSFNGVVDFNPSGEILELTALGSSDAFLNTLTTDGAFVRAYSWGTDMDQSFFGDTASSVACDQFGNVVITGGFYSTVDFDPGPGSYEGTSTGSLDAYVMKLDSSGEFAWTNTWGGTGLDDAIGVAVDLYGTSYIVGHFTGTADFKPLDEVDEHTSNGALDAFINKIPSDGEW